MKPIFYFFIVSLYLLGCSQNKYREIKYELSNDTINVGKINYSDTFLKTVYLKNFSGKVIKIVDIENGCGCTSGNISDSLIKENDSVSIQVSFIPSLTKDSGIIAKYITIRTDAIPPFRNLNIIGEVVK